ncbi:hypothetical protein ACFL0U_00355 [Pseudomonadota bacterium]
MRRLSKKLKDSFSDLFKTSENKKKNVTIVTVFADSESKSFGAKISKYLLKELKIKSELAENIYDEPFYGLYISEGKDLIEIIVGKKE